MCHNPDGGIKPAPKDHAGRTSDTCQMCHKPQQAGGTGGGGAAEATATPAGAGTPPAIPHNVEGRDNCLVCHNPDGGIKPAPKDHAGRTSDTCQMCHKPAA